ncbi:MAG: hypothetical protein R3330_18880 [Saprospiraceae bacterium]|nr:hypothetical protein [Saprospiraceae bacterium]
MRFKRTDMHMLILLIVLSGHPDPFDTLFSRQEEELDSLLEPKAVAAASEVKVTADLAELFNQAADADMLCYDDSGKKYPRMRQCMTEQPIWDKTRVDILTSLFAIEVEWASKQYEAWGQALWYATQTDRRPMVIIITRDAKADASHLYRAAVIAERTNIMMFIEEVGDGDLVSVRALRRTP